HFVQTEAMTQMLPPFVPFATPLVLATGLLEFAIAAGLLHPASRRLAGLAAIAVLVVFFPANVYAAFAYIDIGGYAWGPAYLLIRTPLRIPEHPAGHSDDIRPPKPGYPATCSASS
ncbi:MAG: hypothetical protein AAFQ79_19115, partial [Pseudomonadota bacterium]